jgi:hypothetical protein
VDIEAIRRKQISKFSWLIVDLLLQISSYWIRSIGLSLFVDIVQLKFTSIGIFGDSMNDSVLCWFLDSMNVSMDIEVNLTSPYPILGLLWHVVVPQTRVCVNSIWWLPMERIPSELMFEIFCHSDFACVLTSRLTCKLWSEISKMDGIWKFLFMHIFGKDIRPGKLRLSWYEFVSTISEPSLKFTHD